MTTIDHQPYVTDDATGANFRLMRTTEGFRMNPQRIQLSRAKGWRKPPNTVVVSRPSKWGNPFVVQRERDGTWSVWYHPNPNVDTAPGPQFVSDDHATKAEALAEAVDAYREWATEGRGHYHRVQYFIDAHGLAGKNLACWCPLDQPCHADVLLELANGDSA